MAELLKNRYFQPKFVDDLSNDIAHYYSDFDQTSFKDFIYDEYWDQKALKEMMGHISQAMHVHLPKNYLDALTILRKVAIHYNGFDGMIFPDFVHHFGQEFWEESLSALELFTQYSSAEFAIRSFILKDEERAMNQMLIWSTHKNYHVRRLASEGCRPRLPWAFGLPNFKKDPSLILPILENLKKDPSEYVRKSVANNLNDISKDNRDVVILLAQKWMMKSSPETQWIVKHGFRGLIKSGNSKALKLMGFERANIELSNLEVTPAVLLMGNELEINFKLINKSKTEVNIMVDYILHFVKSNGSTSPKVFKMSNSVLVSGEKSWYTKRHVIKPITTRKYYGGTTFVEIQVNGEKLGKTSFDLMVQP